MIPAMKKMVLGLHWVENVALATSFVMMLSLAVLQILLRNFFESGVFWADAFLRMLILWIALLGAMIATREQNHINIDAISRYFPELTRKFVNSAVALISAVICGLASWYGSKFVLMEYEDDSIAFASVPTWTTEIIIPFAFLVMAIRFMIQFITAWKEPAP
jgi:TRAP-type C4-dicarboxylate transport system permease small subunit